ncbi:MAG: DUF389 domain-containing protein [Vampirovibrionales bacterium]|nr:DUF389 domain-containing protein [Vampirovibrionales bacterium]
MFLTQDAVENRFEKSLTAYFDYMFLVISACLIATFGLLSNSAAVIIGAMVIAPIMNPLRIAAYTAINSQFGLLRQCMLKILAAVFISIALSALLGTMVGLTEFGAEVMNRTHPTLLDLGVALVAGTISGYTAVNTTISDVIAGIAISVALMPPLCTIGLCLSQGMTTEALGASNLFLTNLVGIFMACMCVFVLLGFFKRGNIRKSFLWSGALIFILAIPLSMSLFSMLAKARVEKALKRILTHRTITFSRDVELLKTRMQWQSKPPVLTITAMVNKAITANELRLVEAFMAREMGYPVKIRLNMLVVKKLESTPPVQEPKSLQKPIPLGTTLSQDSKWSAGKPRNDN